jgi:RNA polymerase sigma-70 factor (ECF subfamily)
MDGADVMTMDLDVYVKAIADGDARAFGKWLAGAEPRVRRSLRSFAQAIDAESVLQETLLRVWQLAPDFVPDGSINSLLRYAIRIGHNLAVSEIRRIQAAPIDYESLENVLAAAEDPTRAPDPILRRAIAQCCERLPAKPRQAFDARMASAGGQDDAALAAALGMQLNTFLQNFTRARQALAECLKQRGVTVKLEIGP